MVEIAEPSPNLIDLIGEECLLQGKLGVGCTLGGGKLSEGLTVEFECGPEPGRLQHRLHIFILKPVPLCGTDSGVDFYEDIASLDLLPILDMNTAHDAGFKRLYGLGVPGRHNLAWRCSDDVYSAKARPQERHDKEEDDDSRRDAACGRWGALHNLQRRRQKLGLFGIAAQKPGPGALLSCHRDPPASAKGMRSGRWPSATRCGSPPRRYGPFQW